MKKVIFLSLFLASLLSLQAQADADGCQDSPFITRYPGSTLLWCEEQAFEQYKVAIGPETGYRHIDKWEEVAGKVSRRYYASQGERSVSEVYFNYLNALQKGGFTIMAKGLHKDRNVAKTVGGRGWMKTAYAANPLPANGIIKLLAGSSTVGGSGYVAAQLERPGATIYLVLAAAQYSETEVVVQLDIIEAKAMEDELVKVDADAMSRAIDTYGKVALYGIYFDYDQATIKPESKEALSEIARLLKKRPQLQLYVVGHTDMKGKLGYNMDLSQRRARAVVTALTNDYGIASSRLEPQGVGPLVPVMTNQQDGGRAKNRRVELVER
jgi:OOP family OmpA-OmpF porin